MSHEIERVLRVAAGSAWAIDRSKAMEIVHMLALRAAGQPRDWAAGPGRAMPVQGVLTLDGANGAVHVLRLHGAIVPRGNMMADLSGAVSAEAFAADFRRAAADPDAAAIVLDIDSPGGQVDLVPEAAATVRAARRAGRPIVAVANTLAASAAYWIASGADEIVVTPSGEVGSIGVLTVHDDLSGELERQGIRRTIVSAGARKAEASPYGPLDDAALAALRERVGSVYAQFVADVAAGRGVDPLVVRADPEDGGAHFGGGRSYAAARAVALGMADRVATLDETLRRLTAGPARRNARLARARLRLG